MRHLEDMEDVEHAEDSNGGINDQQTVIYDS